MSSTITGNDVSLRDEFRQDTSGQYIEVDLVDPDDVPIDTAAIDSVVGTLRAIDTGVALFEDQDLLDTLRLTYPGAPGRIRVTFTAADMAASGSRILQRRELALVITYSVVRAFVCTVTFPLVRLLRGVPAVPRRP